MDYSLVEFDKKVIGDCVFTCLGKSINFQFPPRLKSESNNSEWEAKDIWAIEQLKIHKGSGGRKLSMEWEYLATDSTWNADRIANNLRLLKSYFFEFKPDQYPVCEIKFTKVIPVPTKFRLMDVSVAYSDEIVNNGGFHPLHTKVSVNLELATRVNEPGGSNEKLNQNPLGDAQFDWY